MVTLEFETHVYSPVSGVPGRSASHKLSIVNASVQISTFPEPALWFFSPVAL